MEKRDDNGQNYNDDIHLSDGVVVFFDILGFSTALKTAEVRALVNSIKEIRRELEKQNESAGRHLGGSAPDFMFFADSILMGTRMDASQKIENGKRLSRFLFTASWFFAGMLRAGWPLRGAIVAGTYYLDSKSNIFAGSSTVEASEFEKCQEWCGCGIAESAVNLINEHRDSGSLNYVVQYEVPQKKGKDQSRASLDCALSWIPQFQSYNPDGEIMASVRASFLAHGKTIRVADEAKVENTGKFIQAFLSLFSAQFAPREAADPKGIQTGLI
jgi:hypothetical protein